MSPQSRFYVDFLAYESTFLLRRIRQLFEQINANLPEACMPKIKDTAELRRIRKWYDQIMRGPRPRAELEIQFRGYTDQAALLIRRIDEGQPWEDFIMGIDGAPDGLTQAPFKVTPSGWPPEVFRSSAADAA
jgi:hypothetical protein